MLKIVLIILVVIVSLLAIIALLISPIAKSYVNNHGEQLIGRRINVERVRIVLPTGKVKLCNLNVYEDNTTDLFLHLDTLDVRASIGKLLSHELNVKHLIMAGLDVNLTQDGDRFNFSSIIDHFASDSNEVDNDTTPSNWSFGFYNIRFSHWRVTYNDIARASQWKIDDINLEVPGVYFSGERSTDAGLALKMADGGTLTTQLNYNIAQNDFHVKIDIDSFAVANARSYIAEAINISDVQGALDASLVIDGNLSHAMQSLITGTVQLRDLSIADKTGDNVVTLQSMSVDAQEINIDKNRFIFRSVALNKLSSHFDMLSNGNNFSQLFAAESASQQPAPQSESADTASSAADSATQTSTQEPMQLLVERFTITNSSITYNDYTLPDQFSFPLTDINVEAQNLNLSGENRATLNANLPHGGRAKLIYKGRLDDWKAYQNIIFNITNLQLVDISPYSVAYLAHPFTGGTFSFFSHNTIKNSMLDGKNTIDMYKPEVGKRRHDVDSAMNVPLRAALYVIKDRDDKVNINLPISGNIDNPEFSYMKIVWKTLRNLFVKIATSPFRALGNAMGLNDHDLEFIPIEPAQREFTSEQYYTFGKIAEAAINDSSIIFSFEQQAVQATDFDALHLAHKRDTLLIKHFEQLGVPARQVEISTNDSITTERSGYKVSARLNKYAMEE